MQLKTILGECATETLLYKSIFLCMYVNFFLYIVTKVPQTAIFLLGKRVSTGTNGGFLVYLSAMLF